MTKKTLSQKICEECGIKKKRVELYNCKGCKYLINNECERGDNPCKPPYKYIYPDFENNNNNFVKLLELKILTGCTLWGFLSLKGVYMSQKETVLKTIYLILSNKIKFLDDNSREQIKQSIRKADWEV